MKLFTLLFTLLCRFLCGGFFIVSALTKLSDPSGFAQTIAAFGVVLSSLITPVAWLLIITELWVGLGVLCRWKIALAVMIALLVVFIAVLSYGMAIGLAISCGCLGPMDLTGLPQALARDLMLLAMCLWMWFASTRAPENSVK